MLAYNWINDGLREIGETAISETIITPIKQQEPGHFAFYQMSATAMIQDRVLRPWQLFLTRVLREKSYNLVGTNAMKQYKADMGGVMIDLGIDADLSATPARSAGWRTGCSGRTSRGWSSRPTSSRRSGKASTCTASGSPAG